MGILLLMQTNPKVYSSNDALHKKIHTSMPVFRPYKDLTLNRASSLILHFKYIHKNLSVPCRSLFSVSIVCHTMC